MKAVAEATGGGTSTGPGSQGTGAGSLTTGAGSTSGDVDTTTSSSVDTSASAAGNGASGLGGTSDGGSGGGAGTNGATSGMTATAGGQSSGGSTASGAASTSGGAGGAGGTSSVAPSCLASGPGLTTCGENEDESCCESLPVEGGTFSRTYQNNGSGPTGEADPATVSTFLLDKYEVTVGRFRKYVEYLADGGAPPVAGSGKHTYLNDGQGLADSGAEPGAFETGWNADWNDRIPNGAGAAAEWAELLTSGGSVGGAGCATYGSWTDAPGDNEMLPITCTSWYESYAFCIWDGGFLPTEAEWKYAIAGGDEQRMYPWGTAAPGSNNEYAIYDCCYPDGQCSASSGRDTCTGLVNAAPVGFASLGVGRYGQLDLAGSVWEWLLDRYSNNYANPCTDCAYLTDATNNRVLPGGGFHTGQNPYLLSSNRQSVSYDAETYRGDYAVGVRCARSP